MLPGDHKQEPKFNLWPNPNCTSHLLRGGWKLVISDVQSHNLCYVNDVIIWLPLWPIVKGELDLHYDTLACLEQNSLSGYC